MPFFKTTHNIFNTPWEDELWDDNWFDSSKVILPPNRPWNHKKELKFEDVQVWEQIYFESGGTGLYAAWDPYAEMYLITKNIHAKDSKNQYTEIFYGKNAGNRAYKKATELGMPIYLNKIWVEDEDMWVYN
jgi:hypothetical protein